MQFNSIHSMVPDPVTHLCFEMLKPLRVTSYDLLEGARVAVNHLAGPTRIEADCRT